MTRLAALTVLLLSAFAAASPVESTPEKRDPFVDPFSALESKIESLWGTITAYHTTTATAMATVWGTTTMYQTVTGYHTLSAPSSGGCTATATVTAQAAPTITVTLRPITVTLDPVTITWPGWTITKSGCSTAANPTFSVPTKSYGWKRAHQDDVLYARSFE